MVMEGVHLLGASVYKLHRCEDMMGKVALITGANKGIGFEAARQLGQAGFTILLGARDAVRGEEAANKLSTGGLNVRYVPVDLNKATESAIILAKQIAQEFGHLDVLVNNAGVGWRGRSCQQGEPGSPAAHLRGKLFRRGRLHAATFTSVTGCGARE